MTQAEISSLYTGGLARPFPVFPAVQAREAMGDTLLAPGPTAGTLLPTSGFFPTKEEEEQEEQENQEVEQEQEVPEVMERKSEAEPDSRSLEKMQDLQVMCGIEH